MCEQDATDFHAWASEDERVAGVFPWNWDGCPTCSGSKWTPPHTCCMDEVGTRDLPALRSKWLAIGHDLTRPSVSRRP